MPGAERRVQLLATAREIILRDGAGALTMSALADAVGVTKPIVYKHFANSEAVIIEILKDHARGSVLFAGDYVKDAQTIFEFFDGIVECLFEYIAREGALLRAITSGFSSNANVEAYFMKMRARSHRVYLDMLLQQGAPERKANVAAYALMEMILVTVSEFAQDSTADERDTLKDMVRGALAALVPEPGVKPVVPGYLFAGEDGEE